VNGVNKNSERLFQIIIQPLNILEVNNGVGNCANFLILEEEWIHVKIIYTDNITPIQIYVTPEYYYGSHQSIPANSYSPSFNRFTLGALFTGGQPPKDSKEIWIDDVILTDINGVTGGKYHSVIVRPKSINIGKTENDNYEWFGIQSINWRDITPWVHITIPSGLMIHQHIISPHVEGEIKCKDLSLLYTALFETAIDNNNHPAINAQQSNRKYTVQYFKANVLTELKEIVEIIFDGFKVETIGVENIELGTESAWVIRFTADRVVFGTI